MPTKTNSPETLPLTGHLDELRQRIFYILAYLAAGMLAGLYFGKELIGLLEVPALSLSGGQAAGATLSFVLIKPTDIVSIYFKIALYAGAVLSSPAVFYNLWQYIKPAVPKESGVSPLPWFLSGAALFCAGTYFSYELLLSSGYKFLIEISRQVAVPMITLNSYISFALSIIVIGGFIFEMPLASALLTRLRILTPQLLRSKRREAIFALCVIAAVVTPTTDVFNMLLFVVPLVALFEISVITSSAVYRIYIREREGETYEN